MLVVVGEHNNTSSVCGSRVLNLASISMVSKMKLHRLFFLQWDFHLSKGRPTAGQHMRMMGAISTREPGLHINYISVIYIV